MNKEDWIRKLTSRKFWAAIAEFVVMVLLALGAKESTATQVSAIIMAGAAVVAYIVGEGLTDAAGARAAAVQTMYLAPMEEEEKPPAEQPKPADGLDANKNYFGREETEGEKQE